MAYNAPFAVDPSAASTAGSGLTGAAAPDAAQAPPGHGSPAAPDGSEFEQMLDEAQAAGAPEASQPSFRIDGLPGESAPGSRELAGSEAVDDSPEAVAADFLDTAESGFIRLGELIEGLDGSRLYSPQELLKMQLEMHRITLQIEATTKSVSEVVSGTRLLFQQQA